MKPLVMSAFWLSRWFLHVSRRWTSNWSVPCDAIVRKVPPIRPAQNVNGNLRSHENDSTWNLLAASACAAIVAQPPGTMCSSCHAASSEPPM